MMGGPFQGAQVVQPQHPEDESIILDQIKVSINEDADGEKRKVSAPDSKKKTIPNLDIPLMH